MVLVQESPSGGIPRKPRNSELDVYGLTHVGKVRRETADLAEHFVASQQSVAERNATVGGYLCFGAHIHLGDLDPIGTDLVADSAGRAIIDRMIRRVRLVRFTKALSLWTGIFGAGKFVSNGGHGTIACADIALDTFVERETN